MQTYAPAPVTIDRDWRLLIGGKLVGAETGDQLDVVNPAMGEVVTRIPLASTTDVDRAVEAAQVAFKSWYARGAQVASGQDLAGRPFAPSLVGKAFN